MIRTFPPHERSRNRPTPVVSAEGPSPLAAKTAPALLDRVQAVLGESCGVRPETAFALIGALAGHVCAEIGWTRRSALSGEIAAHGPRAFHEISDRSGARMITGAWIDEWLCDRETSFCRIVLSGAKTLGAADLPALDAVAANAVRTFGTDAFARPVFPVQHRPSLPPLELLRRFGPHFTALFATCADRIEDIPAALAEAALALMTEARPCVAPGVAAELLIECAWPMARTHPDDI